MLDTFLRVSLLIWAIKKSDNAYINTSVIVKTMSYSELPSFKLLEVIMYSIAVLLQNL